MVSKDIYILDAFAVMAFLKDEKGANEVERILKRAKQDKIKLYMHNINLGEIYYNILKEEGENKANTVLAIVKQYPVEYVQNISEDYLIAAAKIKGRYPISYADAFAIATAIQKNGILITGDPEFKALEEARVIKVFWIGN